MSSRTRARNRFETGLDGGIGSGDTTITLDSVTGLLAPGILVIDGDSPTLAEIISYTGISVNDLTGVSRGLAGSASGAQAHASAARIASTFMHQHLDDIFDDIEALETADSDHAAAGDPHAVYLKESGGTMTGKITLDADPTSDLHAATKQYVDANLTEAEADALYLQLTGGTLTGDLTLDADPDADLKAATKQYVDAQISGGGIPTGSRMIFDQDAAPTGWTRDVATADDRVIRIVTGARADGGTWTQPDHTHTNPTTGSSSTHTHTGPSHTHSNPATGAASETSLAHDDGISSTFLYTPLAHTHTQGNTGSGGTGTTSAGGAHSHTQPATAGGATAASWRPLHRDMIICVKD